MAKKRFSKDEQMLAVVALIVIGAFFFVKKVYDPLDKEIKELVAKNKELAEKLQELKESPVELSGLKMSLESSGKAFKKSKSKI